MSFTYNQKAALSIMLAAFFCALDRLLKVLATSLSEAVDLIPGLYQFNFAKNYFIAFSLPLYGPWLVWLITLIIFVVLYMSLKFFFRRDPAAFPLFFVVAGAFSNLSDRWRYGFVVDYFDIRFFSVFNIADMMISLGLLTFLLLLIKEKRLAVASR